MEKGVKCFHYKLICQRILSVCLLYHKHQIIYKNAEIKFQKLPKKKLHEEEKLKAAKTNNFLTNNFFLPSQSTAKKSFSWAISQNTRSQFSWYVYCCVGSGNLYLIQQKQQTICFFLPCFSRDRRMSKISGVCIIICVGKRER